MKVSFSTDKEFTLTGQLYDGVCVRQGFKARGSKLVSIDIYMATYKRKNKGTIIIEIYDIDGLTQLSSDDNSGVGLASRIEWTAPATGVYYLRVSQNSGSSNGCDASYQVSIEGETLLFLPIAIRK